MNNDVQNNTVTCDFIKIASETLSDIFESMFIQRSETWAGLSRPLTQAEGRISKTHGADSS